MGVGNVYISMMQIGYFDTFYFIYYDGDLFAFI